MGLWKHKWQPAIVAFFGKMVLSLLARTYRYRVIGLQEFLQTAQKRRCIVAFWHNRLLIISEILKRTAFQFQYAALISQSRDGEMIARMTTSYKNARAIRVPHDGRPEAFNTLLTHLKYGKEILLITPDGPRGPVYEVKPGIIQAALASSSLIIPLHWEAAKSWSFNTWDGLLLPKPFTRIDIYFGKPLELSQEHPLEISCQTLKEALKTNMKT